MISIDCGEYIIINRASAATKGVDEKVLAEQLVGVRASPGLIVIGPATSARGIEDVLVALGLTYPEDYFDVNDGGGSFPLWCSFSVAFRDNESIAPNE
jgi:hypothetical protein